MKTINAVAITYDGLTITQQFSSEFKAAQEVVRWIESRNYKKIVKIFFGTEDGLSEYSIADVIEMAVAK